MEGVDQRAQQAVGFEERAEGGGLRRENRRWAGASAATRVPALQMRARLAAAQRRRQQEGPPYSRRGAFELARARLSRRDVAFARSKLFASQRLAPSPPWRSRAAWRAAREAAPSADFRRSVASRSASISAACCFRAAVAVFSRDALVTVGGEVAPAGSEPGATGHPVISAGATGALWLLALPPPSPRDDAGASPTVNGAAGARGTAGTAGNARAAARIHGCAPAGAR
jgi:hypothetical protein